MPSPFDALHRLPMAPREYVRRCVLIDARSLAAFRIAIALLIVADVLLRSRNFGIYYTEEGAVPQELAKIYAGTDAFSLFYYTEDSTVIAALFALHAIVALFLLVGYRTRIATALSFLFVVSLDHHNPLVLSYADLLFRLLVFWAIFLPLGERWSIDALHSSRPRRTSVANLATAAILLQLVAMYFVNWTHKLPSELWRTGMAGVYVFGIDEMTYLFGDLLRHVPVLTQFGALLWFYLVMLSPLLLLLHQRRRMMLAFLFMGGHLSFALTVRIGAFAYVALAGLLLFLQPVFWDHARATVEFFASEPGIVDRAYGRIRGLGERAASVLPSVHPDLPGLTAARRLTFVVVMVVLIVTVLALPTTAHLADRLDVDEPPAPVDNDVAAVLETVGVSQPTWNIFARPDPRTTDTWYVFAARTADGDVIDIYNDREVSWDRPYRRLDRQHRTYRDRFYLTSVSAAGQGRPVSRGLAEYLCTTWPADHGTELTGLTMWEVSEQVTPATVNRPADRERRIEPIHAHGCGDHRAEYIGTPPGFDG